MCSYWRCSFLVAPRRRFLPGIIVWLFPRWSESRIAIDVLVSAVVFGTTGPLFRPAASRWTHPAAGGLARVIAQTRLRGARLQSRATRIHFRGAGSSAGSAFVGGHFKFS